MLPSRYILYLILLFIHILPLPHYGQIQVHSNLEKSAIYIGQQTTLYLSVTNGNHIDFPQYDSLQAISPGIEVLASKDSVVENKNTKIKRYTITSFDTTVTCIQPLSIKVNGKEYKTKKLPITVLSIEVDTTNIDKIYDLKGVMNPSFEIEEWLTPIYVSIFMMLSALLVTYIIIRLKENKPIIRRFKFKAYLPPHKVALKEIDYLRDNKLWESDDAKNYYTLLTDTLRKYMQGRYGFKALEMTTSEIIQELEKVNDKDMLDSLHRLFATADLVKFAKVTPAVHDNDENLDNAEKYVLSTQKEEVAIVPQKEVIIEDIRSKRAKKILYTCILLAGTALIVSAVYLIKQLIILN